MIDLSPQIHEANVNHLFKQSNTRLAAFDTAMCVCVCLCVGRGSSNKSDGFVGSTVAALFERRPSSVPSASRDRNSSSSLLSTQLVFARNLFSRAVWMCAGLCMLNKEWCIFFFILGRRAANDTTHTRTHTAMTWHAHTHKCHRVGISLKIRQVQVVLRNVWAISM